MLSRCYNSNYKTYHRYGGRGITVCDQWSNSFEAFLADVGHRPTKDHQLERKKNDGNYEPLNVCWATRSEQMRNRSTTILVTHNKKTHTLMEWSHITGLSWTLLYQRWSNKWTPEEIVSYPSKSSGQAILRKRQSRYRGVYLFSGNPAHPWRASIRINGKREHLGSFRAEEDAAHAYDLMAVKVFGEHALLNFLPMD